jgi:predicted GH43/DUF377 family glycosyl hydrolase
MKQIEIIKSIKKLLSSEKKVQNQISDIFRFITKYEKLFTDLSNQVNRDSSDVTSAMNNYKKYNTIRQEDNKRLKKDIVEIRQTLSILERKINKYDETKKEKVLEINNYGSNYILKTIYRIEDEYKKELKRIRQQLNDLEK